MQELPQIVIDRASEYVGGGRRLEVALGALCMGKLYGWRALNMFHSQSTLRDYESVLGIRFAEECDEYTSLSRKVQGIRLADQLGAFWKVVKGTTFKSSRGDITANGSSQGELL